MRAGNVIAGVVFAAIALSGCTFSASTGTGPPVVSKADLQQDITDRLTKAGQPPRSVSCADDLVGEVSRSTRCEVVLSDTNAIEPIVKTTGVDGTTVSYEMTPALTREQLQQQVAWQLAQHDMPSDSVSCDTGLDGIIGDQARCTVRSGGDTTQTVVTVTGVDGLLMNFRVSPE